MPETIDAEPPRPIFIIGAPRSGTSISNWAIGQHPNIQVMPETAWIANYALGALQAYDKGSERQQFSHLSNVEYPQEAFLREVAASVHRIVCQVYEERCQRLYGDYATKGIRINPANPNKAFAVRRHADDPKRRWIDGTPLNSHHAWALAKVFPEARFIHNMRNPADVALSLENFENVGAKSQALRNGLKTWMLHTESAWLLEQALGSDRVFRLDYARLQDDTESLFRELFAFLEEDYCSYCLEPLAKRANSSEVDEQRAGLEKRIKKLWNYRKARKLFEEVSAREITASGQAAAQKALAGRLEQHLASVRLV